MTSRRFFRQFIFIFFTMIFGQTLWADNALLITAISGASNYDIGSATTTPTIYGGVTGLTTNCRAGTGTSSLLCDNCTVADTACNRKRVHQNTYVTISFKVISEITGQIFVGVDNGGTALALTLNTDYTRSTDATLSKDSTGSVSIKWSVLCDLAFADTTCEDPGALSSTDIIYISVEGSDALTEANRKNITLKMLNPDFGAPAIDNSLLTCLDATPSAGVCSFKASPGDRKITITESIEIANSCPTTFTKARFYYSDVSFAAATYSSSQYIDLSMGTDCAPSGNWSISGLNNGRSYYVRASVVDIANNNVFLTDETNQIDTADNCAADDPTNCRFIATPGEVDGLLPEDLNCFIATAAYGSTFAPVVQTLRSFRNQFLLTNNIGREITKFYYEYGPYGARYISDKPFVRAVTRALLTPPWAFAWLAIHYGLSGAFLIVLSTLIGIIYGIRQLRRGTL